MHLPALVPCLQSAVSRALFVFACRRPCELARLSRSVFRSSASSNRDPVGEVDLHLRHGLEVTTGHLQGGMPSIVLVPSTRSTSARCRGRAKMKMLSGASAESGQPAHGTTSRPPRPPSHAVRVHTLLCGVDRPLAPRRTSSSLCLATQHLMARELVCVVARSHGVMTPPRLAPVCAASYDRSVEAP